MIPETPADRRRARAERTRAGRRLQVGFLAFFGLLLLVVLLAPTFTADRTALVLTWWALVGVALATLLVQAVAAWRLRALHLQAKQDQPRPIRPRRSIDFDQAWKEGRP